MSCKFWNVVREKVGVTGWTDCLKNDNVLHRLKREMNVLQTAKRRKANLIGHVLCRNCLSEHFIAGKVEGKVEAKGR